MSGRISYAMFHALAAVRDRGITLSAAAREFAVNVRSLRRAIRRAEKAPAADGNAGGGTAPVSAPPEQAGTEGQTGQS